MEQVDAVDRREPLGRVRGFRRALPTELGQSGRSQPAEVDRGGDGHQRLVRADVGVGLLATDVLFARLEREHVTDLPVDVDRLAADPPGHLANVVHAGRDETEVRTAVVQMVPQRLSLGHRDVGAELAGRRQDAEGERVEHLDRARSPVVGPSEQIAHRLEDPVDVRVLHDHGCHVGSDLGGAAASVRHREDLRLVPRSPAVRAERIHEPWIDGAGDEHPVTTVAAGHVHGLDQRGRSVVQGCVRDLEPGQLADHRLELEQRLQHALRQLRLVRRVRRVELGPTGQRPDDAGDVVVVRASTGEAHQLVGAQVASRERAHVVHELHLGDAGGDVERPVETDVGRGCRRTDRPRSTGRASRASGRCRPRCVARTSRAESVRRPSPMPGDQPDASSRPYFVTRDR